MPRLMPFFLLLWLAGQIYSAVMAGEGTLATAALSQNLSNSATTVYVDSTTGFVTNPYFIIDLETIYCTGKTASTFTGCTRGVDQTVPSLHISGTRVYNETTGVLNQVLGYNVLSSIAENGIILGGAQAVINLPSMLINIVGRLILWDYPFFTGYAVYLRFLGLILNASLIWGLINMILRK